MSENVLMCFKSEKTWKNPLHVWLKFVNTCSKVYSPQIMLEWLLVKKPYKFQLNHRIFSHDYFRYGMSGNILCTSSEIQEWTLNGVKPSCVSFLIRNIFAIFESTEKQVSTRNYLKYLTLLTFTNNNCWTKKKMEVWGYSIYDDTQEWIHAY